jgi:hypothetical protein
MFDQSQIISVNPPIQRQGTLFLRWISAAPAGTWFQVYVNRMLMWSGQRTSAEVPAPSSTSRIDIGTVGDGEARTNFSASLPTSLQNRAELTWEGGSFLDPSGLGDIAGFYVWMSPSPSTAVDFSQTVANVPAYTNGITTDGYGMGGYGAGGYGFAGANYSWTSDGLAGGIWSFAVAAYNLEGAIGDIVTVDLTILGPPAPPASFQGGSRLHYVLHGYGVDGYGGQGYGADGYGAGPYGGGVGYGQSKAVLTWNASG